MLGKIQALNTLAVGLIDDKDYEGAIEILDATFSELAGCLLVPTPIGGLATSTTANSHQNVRIWFTSHLESDPFAVHPCMFLSNLSDSLEDDDGWLTDEQHCCISAVCYFNLGLCYHLKWMEEPIKNGTYHLLIGACHYYRQAFHVARCNSRNYESTTKAVSLLVLKAVCVNLAYCSLQLADLEQCRYWNAQLRQAMRISEHASASSDEYYLESQDFFHRCAFFNSFCGTAASSA